MIRLETPAHVMLAVWLVESGVYAQPPFCFLAPFPVRTRQFPDLGLDGNTDLAGGVQAEKGVLGIRVVAGPGALRVGVGPRARPVDRIGRFDLGSFEPGDIVGDPQLVELGLGGGEDHGLKRDRVRALQVVGPEAAKVFECLANRAASRLSRRP